MKNLTDIYLLKNNSLYFKRIFNFGLFSQFTLKKQLGFNLNKKDIYFNFSSDIQSNLFIIIIYYKILERLIIDTRYYKKIHDYFQKLFENKNYLKRTVRLKMGLPVNGQRSKTNSKNSRKRFYKRFLSRILI